MDIDCLNCGSPLIRELHFTPATLTAPGPVEIWVTCEKCWHISAFKDIRKQQ